MRYMATDILPPMQTQPGHTRRGAATSDSMAHASDTVPCHDIHPGYLPSIRSSDQICRKSGISTAIVKKTKRTDRISHCFAPYYILHVASILLRPGSPILSDPYRVCSARDPQTYQQLVHAYNIALRLHRPAIRSDVGRLKRPNSTSWGKFAFRSRLMANRKPFGKAVYYCTRTALPTVYGHSDGLRRIPEDPDNRRRRRPGCTAALEVKLP